MSTQSDDHQWPTLLAVAHGTADAGGLSANRSLLDLVRAARPALDVQLCWLDVVEPSFKSTLPRISGPVVIVPVLLSTGYHVKTDIPAVMGDRLDTVQARHLGPDRRLCEVAAVRLQAELQAAGMDPAQCRPVRLIGSGSSDPAAKVELAVAAGMLAEVLGLPVSAAQLTDADPLADVSDGYVVANYLLAPGYFDRRLRALASATVVARPLGAHPLIADVILDRYDEALAGMRG